MILHDSPMTFYNKKIDELTRLIGQKKKKSSTIAWLRFLVAVLAAIAVYSLWGGGWQAITIVLVLAFAIFLKLVAVSAKINQEITNLQTLLSINQQEVQILNGQYTHRPDGAYLQPPHHSYAQDLDIFGKASLFQYIHRTTAEHYISY